MLRVEHVGEEAWQLSHIGFIGRGRRDVAEPWFSGDRP